MMRVVGCKHRSIDVGDEDDRVATSPRVVELHAGAPGRLAEARTDAGDDPVLFVGEQLAAGLG